MRRNLIFVKPPVNSAIPIVVSENEWFHIAKHLKAPSKVLLSNEVKQQLLDATNLYASSVHTNAPTKSRSGTLKQITDWIKITDKTARALWAENYVAKTQLDLEVLHSFRSGFRIIQKDFFEEPITATEQKFALAALTRIMFGSVEMAHLVHHQINEDTKFADERRTWFLWAALIFSILRKAKIPVKHPERDNLLGGSVYLLARLQLKLPPELQLRKFNVSGDLLLKEIPESFRKGAVIAYKIRRRNPTGQMQRMLAGWVIGDFSMHGGVIPDNKFLQRFDRLTSPKN